MCLYDPATRRGWISTLRRNTVFLIWNIFGGILIYFYLAGFLEVLLRGQTEEPVDTAQQILDRGLVPFVLNWGQYYVDILAASSIPAVREIGSKTIVPDTWKQYLMLCEDSLQGARTHVLFGNFFEDSWESDYGKYHRSKDTVPGTNPYGANILNKKWPYAEQYNRHLQRVSQVMKPSAIILKL